MQRKKEHIIFALCKGCSPRQKKTYYKDADKTLNHVIEAIKMLIKVFSLLKTSIIYNAFIVASVYNETARKNSIMLIMLTYCMQISIYNI